jgi:quinol-cytochrome oxidoreductase complex cytochrome b subunit
MARFPFKLPFGLQSPIPVHSPILEDIQKKGLRRALWDTADDFMTRLTAGLSIADVRSLLRDDPPRRPNPRLKPHADGFWLHMKPTYYNTLVDGLYPTFRLGWLATFFFAFEVVTGIYLMIYYTPSPEIAYENMLAILSNVPFGRLMRDMHKLGGEAMCAVVLLHMVRTFLTGSYKKPRQFTWLTGVVLLFLTIFVSFFGYLLPWDQLSLWAVTIGASMAEAFPPEVVGANLNLLVRGAPEIGANGLLRAYLIHVVLFPFIMLIMIGVHYYKVVIHGHSLPPEAENVGEDTASKIPMESRVYFMPKILTRELFYVTGLTALLIVACMYLYHAPLEPHAESLVTPLHITAPWYVLFLQGMLKLGDKVLWGVIAPGAITNLLLVLPYIEVGPSRRYGDRRIGLSIGAASIALAAILSFMGTPWYGVETPVEQEAIADIMPQTEPGPIRTAPWGDLTYGQYRAADWAGAPTPTLQGILHRFEEELGRPDIQGRANFEGFLTIEDWQPGLKRVTFRVTWLVKNPQGVWVPGEYSEVAFVHQEALHKVTTRAAGP